jgi:hypothetical protein
MAMNYSQLETQVTSLPVADPSCRMSRLTMHSNLDSNHRSDQLILFKVMNRAIESPINALRESAF